MARSAGGYDIGLMSTAMAIRNEGLARNALEAAGQEERFGGAHGRRSGGHGGQPAKLYAFGSGDHGRLGHGDNMPQKSAKLVEILRDKNVTRFACGKRHTLALTADGAVYSWGYGGDGQLGHGDLQLHTLPAQIKALQGEHVIAIACGDKHSAALTSNGDVFMWGDGSLGQLGLGDFRNQHTPHRVMELQGKMILRLSCGAFHTACIADDFAVYTWGQGGSGRLGHEDEHNLSVPKLVRSLEGKGIQTIRCYEEHTIAMTAAEEGADAGTFDESSQVRMNQKIKDLEVKLARERMKAEEAEQRLESSRSAFIESEQNALRLQKQVDALLAERVDLYMKMQALESQLSISTTDRSNLDKQLRSLVNIPTKLEEIASQGVRQIAVGEKHILALSDAGDVYAWGTGSSGQLGLGKKKGYPSPQLVWGLMRKGVRQIAAGEAHSLALTYNGLVYSWGSSKVGQLGHGNRKTQVLPKLIEDLDQEARERSSTVRLIGAGARHSVAVLGNGELYMWGRPDSGRLGRSKNDALNAPARVDALWRREVAEGHTDRTKALGKQEIAELLDQKLDVHEIERYFPDIQSDPEAALFLAKAVADDLQKRVTQLQTELEMARKESATQLEKYVAEQEKAFEKAEREGVDKLLAKKDELETKVGHYEKTVFFQRKVAAQVMEELTELNAQIEKDDHDREESLAQARTADKSALDKSLRLALDSLRQAKLDKEQELATARRQAEYAQEDLEQTQQQLSLTRVDIKKHEKLGYKRTIEQTKSLVAQISALSQRLAETAIEHIEPSKHSVLNTTSGLRDLLQISNDSIDRICAQAAEFASDDNVDVEVRQQLSTLLFDNAEMRKQLNTYTEGILTQSLERHADHRGGKETTGWGIDVAGIVPSIAGGGADGRGRL